MNDDVLIVPNIGARVFKRPRVRIRNEKTGQIIDPERIAKSLIARAYLEHAVADGVRPSRIVCKCGAIRTLSALGGRTPKRCVDCSNAFNKGKRVRDQTGRKQGKRIRHQAERRSA